MFSTNAELTALRIHQYNMLFLGFKKLEIFDPKDYGDGINKMNKTATC